MQASIIVWIQSLLHPAFDTFFKKVTFLGGFEGFTLIVAFVVWAVSYSFGCRLFLLTLISGYITNFWIKPIVGLPRPYLNHPEIIPLISEKGLYSFPSGHAQNAFVSWGALAWFLKKRWVTCPAILLIFLIGFSRIPLGVHYPTDVLGGWIFGAIYLWLFVKFSPSIANWITGLNIMKKLALILIVAFILSAVLFFFGPKENPVSWQLTALQLFLSTTIGWMLQNHFVGFEAGGPWIKRLIRFGLGAVILLALFHHSKTHIWIVSLAGLWLTLGAPFCFKRLNLSY